MVLKPVLKNVEKKTGQKEVRPVLNHAMRVNHQNFSNSRRNFAPTAVLTKYGIVPISTARQSSSRVVAPVRKSVTSAVGKQGSNAVKSSACWVWRPKIKVQDHVSKNSGSYIFKKFDYVDPEGRLNGYSQHMIGNKSFLSDYQEYDGGFVAFAGSSKGGKITGKGKIRTGKLDFKDVYFVKELNFNLFSVSKIKFDVKADEEFLVGYSLNSKAFRVYNSKTKKVEENLHVNFLENKPNVAGNGPKWLFDIDSLTNLMNYQPVSAGNRTNGLADVPSSNEKVESSPKDDAGKKSIVEPTFNADGSSFSHLYALDDFSKMPNLEDTRIFDYAYDDRDGGAEADYNNLETVTQDLDDESWVEAMQEELFQFKLLNV
nr:ribonuclease H-like domain-containing protein [Tanacetum cinerariifolium]GEZ22415.1 ribonuclease H-like domain-containing protein [Tanacetum cinerariifolium]